MNKLISMLLVVAMLVTLSAAALAEDTGLADVQTSFKVYSSDECVYFGVKCYEPDMASVIAGHPFHDLWGCDAIELFLRALTSISSW